MSGQDIRQAASGEIAEIMELIAACVQVMQAGGSDQWDETYPNQEILLADIAAGTLYAYFLDGAVAGILVLDEHQSEQYREIQWPQNEGTYLVMHRLAVHPEAQGKGIARKLITFAEQLARKKGYTGIRLDTYSKNTPALALYKGMGYELRGEVKVSGRTAGFPVFEKRFDTDK
ncbi:GNAT family N-acetyltransferase ['Paenibacillus yunnanensis' Narsing Rao et al. 2020]|uniref:GNAT family N-acetyltransferase n=1 Tax=Paenibacillus tengchongensis TaxID=2608684 RepID=UPI00124D6AA0|nr:GNAT family N-acetyltransferase [Paenibacillus tengchongensis]